MNIFHKVALQGLVKNRARTFVTIIGVILSTAMFTSIMTFGTSLINYMVNAEIAKGGDWHVAFWDVDSAFMQERGNDKEVVGTAAFENVGYALLDGVEESDGKPYLFIAGFNEEAFGALPVKLIAGRLPENSGEVIIPSHIAIKAGVKIPIGDTIVLAAGDRMADGRVLTQHDPYVEHEVLVPVREITYSVVGTYERLGFGIEEHEAPGYTVITKSDMADRRDCNSLFVTVKNPYKVEAYAEKVAGGNVYALNEDMLRFMGVSDNKIFNTFLYSIGGMLTVIIMVGSVFLIYNAFNISLNERTHQFGILMSVGATARQLQNSVLFEGICIGIIGIPIGILVGIGSITLILPVVAKNFATVINSDVPLSLAVSVPALAVSAVASLVTILISAYIPARKAAATPVMECIRQTNEIKTEEKMVRTAKFSWSLYGLEGTLALKNFKRNKRRYRSIVLSLTLSVVLVVASSTFSTALKRIAEDYTVQGADGDVYFVTEDMREDEFVRLYGRLKDADGIYKSTWQVDPVYYGMVDGLPGDFLEMYREALGEESAGAVLYLPLYTQFIEDEIYYGFVESLGLPREEYTGYDAKYLVCGVDSVNHFTFFTGSSMDFTLLSSDGEAIKTICATFEDSYPLDTMFEDVPQYLFIVTAPLSAKPQFEALDTLFVRSGMMFWTQTPSQTLAQVQAMVMEEGVHEDYTLHNVSTAFELFRSAFFVIDVFTYVFVGMISLIAVANVFNTISTNIRLRRRELAMLRSVGMSERGFKRMMNFECAFYGMRTLVYGVPVAAVVSWIIHKVILSVEEAEGVAYEFPWGAMAVSVLGVFGIVFITMLYATGKIRKENIIDALRDEMA